MAALRAAGHATPVGLVGGVTSLRGMQDALDDGFAFVQLARALIREPDFVHKIKAFVATAPEDAKADIVSKCIHCNECVVATMSGAGIFCPQRALDEEF
jgi:2,4-dienoyl-CoA reductase-like NADH-dependent reductase (Old Yellow Enzyme family)